MDGSKTFYLPKQELKWTEIQKKKQRGYVNAEFVQRLKKLLKIVFPSWYDKAILDIVLLTVALFLRTYLSIYLSGVNGMIVKSIVDLDFKTFLKRIMHLGMISFPASFVNSSLDFLNRSLAINFRQKLTDYFNK